MSLIDRLTADGKEDKTEETITRKEEVSLPCSHAEAIQQVEAKLENQHNVKHIKGAKAWRYSRHWRVRITAVVEEELDK